MGNYKRRKPRRSVRCSLCSPGRVGNSAKDGYGRPGWKRRLETSAGNGFHDWDDIWQRADSELDWCDDGWDDLLFDQRVESE